jgi:hypothetical protein
MVQTTWRAVAIVAVVIGVFWIRNAVKSFVIVANKSASYAWVHVLATRLT